MLDTYKNNLNPFCVIKNCGKDRIQQSIKTLVTKDTPILPSA